MCRDVQAGEGVSGEMERGLLSGEGRGGQWGHLGKDQQKQMCENETHTHTITLYANYKNQPKLLEVKEVGQVYWCSHILLILSG